MFFSCDFLLNYMIFLFQLCIFCVTVCGYMPRTGGIYWPWWSPAESMPPSHQLTCNHQVCKIQNSTIKRIVNLEFWNIACRDIMFISIHGTYYWCLINYGNYIIGSFYYIIGFFKVISSSMLYFPDLLKLYLSYADLDQLLPHHAWLITPWWQYKPQTDTDKHARSARLNKFGVGTKMPYSEVLCPRAGIDV